MTHVKEVRQVYNNQEEEEEQQLRDDDDDELPVAMMQDACVQTSDTGEPDDQESEEEEEQVTSFLKQSRNIDLQEALLLFYIQRCKYPEAIAYSQRLNQVS